MISGNIQGVPFDLNAWRFGVCVYEKDFICDRRRRECKTDIKSLEFLDKGLLQLKGLEVAVKRLRRDRSFSMDIDT